jgi:hypothetical protein
MMTAIWISLIAFAGTIGFFAGAGCRLAKREDEITERAASIVKISPRELRLVKRV